MKNLKRQTNLGRRRLAMLLLAGLLGTSVPLVAANSLQGSAERQQQAQKRVTGIVLDENGEAVVGASVYAKGTKSGGVTDLDGRFSL